MVLKMRWSKSILKSTITTGEILEYVPHKFDLGTSEQAIHYLEEKSRGADFRMSDVMRDHTGIADIEKSNEELRIEEKSLEKLKEIQESAYKEAYKLGLDEGRTHAFEKSNREIMKRLEDFDQCLLKIKSLKKDLENFNESHLIELVFSIASRVVFSEVKENEQTILQALRQAVQLAQDEEKITVQVSSAQFEFMEEAKKRTGREFEFLKNMTFEPSEGVTAGGCVVTTNYGEVDSRVEQRLQSIWERLKESMPAVKNVVGG